MNGDDGRRRPFPLERIAGAPVPDGGAVFLGNVASEHLWEPAGTVRFPYVANERVRRVVNRCDELQLFVAGAGDAVITRRPLDAAFTDYLASAGLALPPVDSPATSDDALTLGELALADDALVARLAARAPSCLVPYAGTPPEAALGLRIGARLAAADPALCARLNDKAEARRLAQAAGLDVTAGRVCGVDELVPAYHDLARRFQRVAFKELYGVSGRGIVLVDSPARADVFRRALARRFAAAGAAGGGAAGGGGLLVEGWYEATASLNCQFLIGDGAVYPYFAGAQLLDGGMFIGSVLPAAAALPADEVARHMAGAGRAAEELARLGYRGVAGIDTLATRDGELFPVIEINARFNFSTYFYAARRLLGSPPAAVGRWFELRLERALSFDGLLAALGAGGGGAATGRGCLVMTFGSVNANVTDGAPGPVMGRVFVLTAGDSAAEAIDGTARLARRVARFNAGEL